MASPFKRTAAANIGVTPTSIITVPASKVITIIDCSCANVEPGLTEVKATVRLNSAYHLIKNGPVPAGGTMVVVGAPRKVVMTAGDTLDVVCDKATGLDVTLSYLEQDA